MLCVIPGQSAYPQPGPELLVLGCLRNELRMGRPKHHSVPLVRVPRAGFVILRPLREPTVFCLFPRSPSALSLCFSRLPYRSATRPSAC